jgi:hypothetical protein
MVHVYDVLEAIDDYLFEAFSQNEKWENEMRSW